MSPPKINPIKASEQFRIVCSSKKTPSATRWNNKEIAVFSIGTGFAFGISGAAIGTAIAPGLGTLIGFIVGIAAGILFGVITTTCHNNSNWDKKVSKSATAVIAQ